VSTLLMLLSCAKKPPEAAPSPGFLEVDRGELFGGLMVHTFVYDNGLRLMVVPDASAPVVAYQTWYGVGNSDEEAQKTGLAHLFEHMMFKTTEDYGEGHYSSTLSAMGANGLNAWTWLDETVYVQSVPTAALGDLAKLESTRMTRLVVDADALDSEREVVINERRLRTDNDPDGKLSENLWKTAFTTHTYGWPTVGWEEDLNEVTVEDCVDFYRRWYAPNNATIVLAGDVTPEGAAALIQEHYGDLEPSGIARRTLPQEPAQAEQRQVEVELQTTTDRLLMGIKVPAASHPDVPALTVLDAILTSGRSGRLIRALEDAGYASDVGSFFYPMQEPGLMEVSVTARDGVPAEQLQEVLQAELATLAAGEISEAEVSRARNQALAAWWDGNDAASGRASAVGWFWTTTGDWRGATRLVEGLEAVTLDDVKRVAATWLDLQQTTVVVGRSADETAAIEATEGDAAVARKADAPEVRAAAGAPELSKGTHVEQAHGGTVVLDYDPAVPLLSFRLALPTGTVNEAAPGVANLGGKMLLRGTKRLTRSAFEEAVEDLGASVEVAVGRDTTEITGQVMASAWPALSALIEEALSSPGHRQGALDELRAEVINELGEALDDDRSLAFLAWDRAWFGADHPYGRSALGTEASVSSIELEAIEAWHAGLSSVGAVVGLSGAFDAQAQADLEGWLAALGEDELAAVELPEPVGAQAEGRRVVIVDKPERTQLQVVIGHEGRPFDLEGFPATRLGNAVLGRSGFDSRLMKEVRVERGWSYYAYSYHRTMWQAPTYVANLAPGVEYAVDATQLVLDLMASARDEGVTAEELEQVRSSQLNSAPFLADTSGKRMQLRVEKELSGQDHVALNATFGEVTLEQVDEHLASELFPERALVVLVATADDVAEAAASVGEVEVVPYEELR